MPTEIDLFVTGFAAAHERFLAGAVRAFNSCQREYLLNRRNDSLPFQAGQEVDWPTVAADYPSDRPPGIVVTSAPLADNWFSHCDGRLAVISTDEWFRLYAPPCLESFLLSEFVIAVACQTVGVDELVLRPHESSIGCVADMCAFKPEVLLKLRAGYACPEHVTVLRQLGATEAQVAALQRALNLTRAFALGRDDEKRGYGAYTNDRVFVVHGRDQAARLELERFLSRIGLTPIAVMDEPPAGRTIIEQIEANSDVGYAFILMTPDDDGRLRGEPRTRPRPRQNVVFEYGFFVGLLGRDRVCCVTKVGPLELPSDLCGVLQLRWAESIDEVAVGIIDELRRAGYAVRP